VHERSGSIALLGMVHCVADHIKCSYGLHLAHGPQVPPHLIQRNTLKFSIK